jgi:pimeloyl-ACP methyl ester carboxylesterase
MEPITFSGFEGLQIVGDVRGNGRPVLFLHGGGQTRHSWGRAADLVANEGWRAITIDLRGHGDSEWSPNGDYSFTAHCADVISVVDQIGEPPVLVGASLGGMASMLAEGTSDRTVSCGLVLVDIAPMASLEGVQRIRRFMMSGIDGFDSMEDAARAIAAYNPHRERPFNPIGLQKVLRQRDGRWYWHWDPMLISQDRTEVVTERYKGLLDVAIDNIRVPTMLVRGLLSDVVTQEGVDDLVTRIPDITVVEVAGAAHMIAGDKNDDFASSVIAFLNERIKPRLID